MTLPGLKVFILKNNTLNFYILLFTAFLVYFIFLIFSGYFEIGFLSDDYLNFTAAANSSVRQKLTSSIPYISTLHLRPVLYFLFSFSLSLNQFFGIARDNFTLFRIESLIYFYILIYLSSYLLFKITGKLFFTLAFILLVMFFPNNLNSICWTVGQVDLLCCIFLFSSLLFTCSFVEEKKSYKIYVAVMFFLAALLTKETAVIIPFITILIMYISYGKDKVFDIKRILGLEIFILILYFLYRNFLLGFHPGDAVTRYQRPGLFTTIGVTFKALISLIIPFDYLSIQNYIVQNNLFFAVYLLLIVISVIAVIFIFLRTGNYKYIFLLSIIFIISISSNLIVGYFRPQLILIPFVIFVFCLLILFSKLSVDLRFFQIILFLLLVIFVRVSFNMIQDWKYSYERSVTAIKTLGDVELDTSKKNIILGLPSRFRQAYMLDYAAGPYNYWKYGEFDIKDKISDMILTGSLDANSMNAEVLINKITDVDYELMTSGETQYFLRLDATGSRYKDEDIEFRLSDKNSFRKPTIVRLRLLSGNADVYVFSGDKFIKLNR